MRFSMLILTLILVVAGCSSTQQAPSRNEVTKEQVIDMLGSIEGRERAEESYARWMAEVRPKYSNDSTAHRKILEAAEHIQKLVTGMKQHVDETKDRLFHRTDHRAVLAAARQVIPSRRDYSRDAAVHGPENPELSIIADDDPKLPAVLRRLRAARLLVTDEQAMIEFGGGFTTSGCLPFERATPTHHRATGARKS
jgi:hypothetical protein